MNSSRRFGVFVVASVIAIALIPLQALPASALGSPAPKATTADKLAPLPTDDAPKPKLDVPTGDFSDPPPAHVDQGAKPQKGKQSFDPSTSKLIDRNSTTDVYENADGTRTAQISQNETNAKDDKGNWQKIDSNLSKKRDGRLHNNFGKFDASFADSADADDLGKLKSGDKTLTFSLDGAAKGSKATSNANVVSYDDVFADTDLNYEVGTSLVSETLVLNTKPQTAPTYRFKVSAPGLTPSVDDRGTINYKDKSGNTAFRVPRGVAWDSNMTGDYQLKGKVTIALGKDNKYLDVTPDWNWLNDPARQFPVTIDPDFGLGADDPLTAHDAWTASDNPTTTFNGNAQKDPLYGNKFENLFGHNSTNTDYTSELFINTDAVKSTYVNSASLNIYSWEVGGQPACIYPNSQDWDEDTVTHNTRPNHYGNCNNPSDPNKVRVSLTNNAYTNIDISTWVRQWADGTTPNYGFTMDTGGATAIYRTGATEQRANGGQAPYLSIDYTVPLSTPTGPADNETTMLTTPTLTSTSVTPPVGMTGAMQYWYRVSNTDDPEFGGIINSGLQSSPSWTIPDGSLEDGVTYSWYVLTYYGSSGTYHASEVRRFKVNLRLGQQSVSPMDTEGPVSVNLANGNAMTSTSSPSFNTVGGSVGMSYTYNSKAPQENGLTAAYYPGCDSVNHEPQSDAYIVRREPSMSLYYSGSNPPGASVPLNGFCATFDGFITVPRDNTYFIETVNDDGVRVQVGTHTLVNRWQDEANGAPQWGTPGDSYGFTGQVSVPIHVDWYNNTGTATLQLWIYGPDLSPTMIPSSWLTTTRHNLSQGWSLSTDTDATASYAKAIINPTSVSLVDAAGSSHEYKLSNPDDPHSGYTTPVDERSTLSLRADGSYLAESDDGMDYEFNTAGAITRVFSPADDTNPSAPQFDYYTTTDPYDSGLNATRLKTIKDPVPNRTVLTLIYSNGDGGTPTCANAPSGFDSQAPSGMLCELDYLDGTSTKFYYSSGQLARILDPDNEVTDFGYGTVGSNLLLTKIRDSVQSDWVAQSAGTRDNDASRTLIAYNTNGTVQSVQLASTTGSTSDSTRHAHSYNYVSPNETRMTVAGMGSVYSSYAFNGAGQTTTATDVTGATTQNQWNDADQLLSTISDARQIGQSLPAGNLAKETTTFYDIDGKATDTYGPAPSYCFGSNRLPNGSCTNPSVAHTTTTYDGNFTGGNNGLAAAYWAQADFAGGSKYHAYINGNGGNDIAGSSWAYPAPSALGSPSAWSARLSGRIQLASAGNYNFWGTQNERIYIDDNLVYDSWTSGTTYQVAFNNMTANTSHRVRIDYNAASGGTTPGFVWTTPTNGTQTQVPGSVMTPNYGLVTQVVADDNTSGSPATTVTTSYANPAYGLATSSTNDPSGQNLTTQASYESLGTGYFRKTSTTLPAGNGYSYTYYGNNETITNPCTSTTSVSQAGFTKTRVSPGSATTENFVYDLRGRVIAAWRTGDSNPSCITYDTRGRVATKTSGTFGGSSTNDTTTYNYAVGSDPMITQVSHSAAVSGTGPIATTTDLIGQVTSYKDEWQQTTTYAYDQVGHQLTSTGNSDARATTYDSYGRPQTQTMGYDQASAQQVASATYDTSSNLTHVDYNGSNGNGTVADFTQDKYGHAASVTYKYGATTLASDAATYSQSHRVVSDSINGATASAYTYDGAGRLTNATNINGHTYSYAFASSGGCGADTAAGKNTNRTSSQIDGGTATTYCYDNADRLTSTTAPGATGTISYDGHGNTTTLGGNTMTYDSRDNHLSTTSGGETTTYVRDANGRIIQRSTAGTPALRSTSTASTNGATSLAINTPQNAQPNDLLLAHVVVNSGSASTITAPSGWTQITSRNNDVQVRSAVFRHVVTSGDPTSFTFNFNGTYQASGGIASYSGVDTATPVDDWNSQTTTGTSTSWNSDAALASHNNDRMVVFSGARQSTNATPSSGQTEQWEVASSGSTAGTRAQSEMSDKAGITSGNWYTGSGTLATAAYWVSQVVLLNPKTTTIRYAYSNGSDNSSATMDTSNNVIDKTVGLFGGVSRTIHYDSGGNANPTWQYPNLHGDILIQANQSGAKTAGPFLYDPYGQPLAGSPDDLTQNMDYGWLGAKQRPTEQEGNLNIIEMGARQYSPLLGRFIEKDPVEGGSANDYDYCGADPVNCTDLAGTFMYSLTFDLGKTSWTPARYMKIVRGNFGKVFPIAGRPATLTGAGQVLGLRVGVASFPVVVSWMWSTGWRFQTLPGHPDYPGWINFDFEKSGGHMYLQVDASIPFGAMGWLIPHAAYVAQAKSTWGGFASNLRSFMSHWQGPVG